MKNKSGTLYGIGVGPGDPELLTLKAHRLINECDVLAYPAPEVGEGLALQIVSPLLTNDPYLFPLRLPIAVSPFPAQQAYDQATKDASTMAAREAEFEPYTRLGLIGQQLAQIQPGAFPTTTVGYQQSAAPASPMASFLGGAAGAGGILGKLGIFG